MTSIERAPPGPRRIDRSGAAQHLDPNSAGVAVAKEAKKCHVNHETDDFDREGNMASIELPRDAVKVDAKHYKVELENDRVRVVRISYAPGEKSVMHQHPPGVVVFLTDGKFKFTFPDGKTEDIEAKAGQFLTFPEQWEHLPESLTQQPFEAIYIDLKS